MADVETAKVQDDVRAEDHGEIGTLSGVLSGGEITVGEPEEVAPQARPEGSNVWNTMVSIRVNETIEDMSIVAGGRRMKFSFEVGHVYNVPLYVAVELEKIRKVWH